MIFTRLLAVSLLFVAALVQAEPRQILQLVDYVGVDYPGAVVAGEIVNADEYREMVEFSARIRDELASVEADPQAREQLLTLANRLVAEVQGKAASSAVAAVTQQIRNQMMLSFDVDLLPRTLPDLANGAALYQQNCGGCHGVSGMGDGPLAAAMEPAPTDFHDLVRARERSLFGLYNTITLGVQGTAMPGFNQLSDGERWSLAFYVGGLFGAPGDASLWDAAPLTLEQAVTLAPAELALAQADGQSNALFARHHPEQLFAAKSEALDIARAGIRESVELYQLGDRAGARQAAVTAYLEGFELVEAPLQNVSVTQMRAIESAMMSYRALLDVAQQDDAVVQAADELIVMLDDADRALAGDTLSPSVAFTSSLIILLREGLEAILVVAAMAAFLIKTGRRDAMRWLHAGWVLAVGAGVATWGVSTWLFAISGATREITEGFTALIAAGILFYVGFWMHSRANAQKWNEYIKTQMSAAISKGALWSFAIVSFLAVYREIFETILFYQALWAQVDISAHNAVVSGALSAVVLLVLVTVAINRFGMRLPLAQFFTITAYLMITLAFVFAGKGVAALQEAGRLPMDPVSFPRIELLGIYPNLQGLLLQLAVVVCAVGMLLWQKRKAT